MKDWVKHLIGTVAFGLIYALMGYLFTKNIDWKIIIVATLIYALSSIIIHIIDKKLEKKK